MNCSSSNQALQPAPICDHERLSAQKRGAGLRTRQPEGNQGADSRDHSVVRGLGPLRWATSSRTLLHKH